TPTDHDGLDSLAMELSEAAVREVAGGTAGGTEPARSDGARSEGIDVGVAFDCRYAGQSHELTVASVEEFHVEHERRNGFARPDAPVEVIAVRAIASLGSP